MTGPGLPPAEAIVACQGDLHRLAWTDGVLTAVDHEDVDGELVLGALGGDAAPCAQIVRAWRQAADDPRVLVIASRGPGDPITTPADPRWPAVVRAAPAAAGSSFGWYAYAPMSGAAMSGAPMPGRQHWNLGGTDEPGDLLTGLLELGGGLPERLVATVVATWADRLAAGTATAAVVPALTAALVGRARAAVRQWRHDPRTDVAVTMLPPGSPATLRPAGDGLALELPFSWLAEVWVPGLALLLDRFTLSAVVDGPRLVLDTAVPGADRRSVVITMAD